MPRASRTYLWLSGTRKTLDSWESGSEIDWKVVDVLYIVGERVLIVFVNDWVYVEEVHCRYFWVIGLILIPTKFAWTRLILCSHLETEIVAYLKTSLRYFSSSCKTWSVFGQRKYCKLNWSNSRVTESLTPDHWEMQWEWWMICPINNL
jgi:hypothetical protein